MHTEILSPEQVDLLRFIQKYANQYYMVGDTATALHIGHRKSIDFDLFTEGKVNTLAIQKHVFASAFESRLILKKEDQVHFLINGVKVTFFQFPFSVPATIHYKKHFRMPDLVTLASMKAFALGGRGKWKDYMDLYYLIKDHLTTNEICDRAKELFKDVFNTALFYKQLCYFDDISFEEQIEFMPGFEVSQEEVKSFLTNAALTGF